MPFHVTYGSPTFGDKMYRIPVDTVSTVGIVRTGHFFTASPLNLNLNTHQNSVLRAKPAYPSTPERSQAVANTPLSYFLSIGPPPRRNGRGTGVRAAKTQSHDNRQDDHPRHFLCAVPAARGWAPQLPCSDHGDLLLTCSSRHQDRRAEPTGLHCARGCGRRERRRL